MSKQAVALIAGLLVAGLLVAGCGGDDNDASGATGSDGQDAPTIAKAALVKRGDAACAKIEKSITAQSTKLFNAKEDPDGPNFQVKVVRQVLVPEYQTMVDDIEALGVPAGSEEQFAAVTDAMEDRVVAMGEDPEGFFKPDATDRAEYKEFAALVNGFGFKRCYQ